jgi:hypothetical protein
MLKHLPVDSSGLVLLAKLIIQIEASFCETSNIHFNKCPRKMVSKVFLYLIKQRGMPARRIVEVELHELLNMAMNGGEIKFYCQVPSRPRKQPTV